MGKHHFTIHRRGLGLVSCLGCKRPIFYGERCESCKRELRQRQRQRRKRR